MIVLGGYWIGRLLRSAYDAALAQAVHARDELLRLSAAHAAELQQVSGEVSREVCIGRATLHDKLCKYGVHGDTGAGGGRD